MDDVNDFMKHFKAKDFSTAIDNFLTLNKKEQESIFSELFQKSEHQRMPIAASINFRELQDDKTFDDFHQAWLPSSKWINPTEEGGQKYLQFITEGATRIFNAVNIKNPREIITIGLHWVDNKEQYEWMLNKVKNIGNEPSNQDRHDRLKMVCDKKSGGFYIIKSDDNLGTPF